MISETRMRVIFTRWLAKISPRMDVHTLAAINASTRVNTVAWCVVSSSFPGFKPSSSSPTSRMACGALPGMPKATVGSSAPPSLASLEASGASTPSGAPRPKLARLGEVAWAWAYARKAATLGADPRDDPHHAADDRAPEQQEGVGEYEADAVEHVAGRRADHLGLLHQLLALDRQKEHLGDGEDADGDDAGVDPVPEIQEAEGEPLVAGDGRVSDEGHQESQPRGDKPLDRLLLGQRRDQADSQQRHEKKIPAARTRTPRSAPPAAAAGRSGNRTPIPEPMPSRRWPARTRRVPAAPAGGRRTPWRCWPRCRER